MRDDFEYIKGWCLFVVQYLTEKSPNVLMGEFKNNIKGLTNSKKSLRQLKTLKKDLTEWARGLSEDDIHELNNLLSENFEENLEDVNFKSLTEVKHIVKRGKINNEDEFRLLMARVEEIYADDTKKAELENINKLLADYDKR